MQFGFMSEKGRIDAVFIFRKLNRTGSCKKKVACFVDMENAFDRVQNKAVKWAINKKIPEIFARSVMSLY